MPPAHSRFSPPPHTPQAIARKRQQKHLASRVLLQADHIVWRMCTPAHDFLMQVCSLSPNVFLSR